MFILTLDTQRIDVNITTINICLFYFAQIELEIMISVAFPLNFFMGYVVDEIFYE